MNKWTKKNKTKKNKTKKNKTKNNETKKNRTKKNRTNTIIVTMQRDPYPKSYKKKYDNWFYFKFDINQKNTITQFSIPNIRTYNNCNPALTNDWNGFQVCYSYDNKIWRRLSTTTVECIGKYTTINWTYNNISKNPTKNRVKNKVVWFAYYVPYPFSKTQKLFPNAEVIGYSNKKLPILLQRYGYGPTNIWLISGQHPAETFHAWMLEGFVKRLLEAKTVLFSKYTFYIVPNANPDGNVLNYTRLNAQGINLNRDWLNTKSPEISSIKAKMTEIGYDMVFDLHGDEGSTHHFFTRSYQHKHPLHDIILKRLVAQKHLHFQYNDHYPVEYTKSTNESTLDAFSHGITVEGALKHPLYDHKTLQDEPLGIGKALADILLKI